MMTKLSVVAMSSLSGGDFIPLLGVIVVAGGKEYSCQAWMYDPDTAYVTTSMEGRSGQNVQCRLTNIGILTGTIRTVTKDGFHLAFVLGEKRRGRVATRLAWQQAAADERFERRGSERIVPSRTDTMVQVPGMAAVPGMIWNLSKTGALIELQDQKIIEAGGSILVGKRFARVVRLEDRCIAVEFLLPFTEETFNADVMI